MTAAAKEPTSGADQAGSRRTEERWRFQDGDVLVPGRLAVRLLGGGERYETYLAWDERLYSLVVVKVVRPHLVDDDRSLRGLAAEADLLERLRHPVIVRRFDAVLEGPRPHLVLEHLEGPRLSTLVRKFGPLEPEQILPLALQLSSALHYLGAERIVHLDVKPSNIIMGAPARLIDLSIARSLDDLQNTRRQIGTDAYMAPEQCDPVKRGPVTAAADIWGVGVTLYYAASGRLPFGQDREAEGGSSRFPQLHQAPASPPASVAPDTAAIIGKCLEPDAAARPTPAQLAADIEPMIQRLPKRPVLRRFRIRPDR